MVPTHSAHVLNVGGGHLAPVVLLQVPLHGAHVELRVLVAELAGEQRRRAADDACSLLQRTVDAPAARSLIHVALDLDHAVGRLVRLGSRPRAVSFIGPTRIGLPSVSKRFSASSVAQQPTSLVASRIASSISSSVPSKRTVTDTVSSLPDLLSTLATRSPSLAYLTGACRVLLEMTLLQGRTLARAFTNPFQAPII
jgi:hypothetical protein